MKKNNIKKVYKPNIILGTAKMHRIWSDQKFNSIIEEALNLGINKFDVAPLYGSGITERRLAYALKNIDSAEVNTKSGLMGKKLLFKNSLLEYWLRYIFSRFTGNKWTNYQDLKSFTNCVIKSSRIFKKKNLSKINTLFVHELPTKKNKDYIPLYKKIDSLEELRKSKLFKNIGLAGENVFLYKKIYEKKSIQYIQTSAENFISSKQSDVVICLNNVKGLNLYGIQYVDRFCLNNKIVKVFDKLNYFPDLSILTSCTRIKFLEKRLKEAKNLII